MTTTCTVDDGAGVLEGDALCLVGWDGGHSRPKVGRATRTTLATSKTVFGVAFEDKGDGLAIEVYVAGEAAPEAKTSLGAGDSRIIATDINQAAAADQCRLVRVDRPDGSEHVVGTCDENGNLAIQARASLETSNLHVFNVKSYGAVGDGVTDDAPAVRAALAAMGGVSRQGGTLYFPPTLDSYAFKSVDPDSPDAARAAVVINRQVRVLGASAQGGYTESTIKVDWGISGFFVAFPEAEFAEFKDLFIWSYATMLNPEPDPDPVEIPRPARTPGATYVAGDIVRLDDDNRIYMECTVGGKASGDSNEAVFVDAPMVDHLLTDDYPDGFVTWRARIHSAIIVARKCRITRCKLDNWSGPGVFIAAGSSVWDDDSNANTTRLQSLSIGGSGLGVYIKGTDTNAILLDDVQVSDAGIGPGHTGTGGHGFWDDGYLGNTYVSCQVESGTGKGVNVPGGSVANHVFVGMEIESSLGPALLNDLAVVIGGSWACGFEPGNFTRIGTLAGTQGLNVVDERGSQVLRAFVDGLDGVRLFGMLGETSEGSHYIAWKYAPTGVGGGYWGHCWGSNVPGYYLTGNQAFPAWDAGFFGVPYGMILGNPLLGEQMWFGTHDSLARNNDVRGGLRKQGDRFLRDDAMFGCWASRVCTNSGARGIPWTAGMGAGAATSFSSATVVEPFANTGAGGEPVYQCVASGTADALTEPDWSGAPDPSAIIDGTITWALIADTTPTLGYTEKVESPYVAQTPQTTRLWKDSADTLTTAPSVVERERRLRAQTTTAAAAQILDDGGVYGTEDFTLPENAITRVSATLLVKKDATAAGGTIDMLATFYRDGAGAATPIGSATITSQLEGASLDGTTAVFHPNGGKVEILVSPESADTLHWGVIRQQRELTE